MRTRVRIDEQLRQVELSGSAGQRSGPGVGGYDSGRIERTERVSQGCTRDM